MVKNKREVITPRIRRSLSRKQRALDINKVLSRPNSSTCNKERTSTANIKVIVRVRPPNNREQDDNYCTRQVVKVVDDDMLIFDPKEDSQSFFFHGVQQKGRDLSKKVKKNMKFNFDKIYAPGSTNHEVFEGTTCSLINNIMDGYNCSVFAYGATGAGKTFTMTGTSDNPGITFLTMTELFKKQEELENERDFEIAITYLEVYNELVKDLLNPGPALNLREDSSYGVIVAGIKFIKINNASQLFSLLQQGNTNRTQHPTDANAESSRSHAVFQVYLQMTMKVTKEVRTAKLSMIDLAGSERGSATGYVGARFTEGANINKSLLALGNCINSLADGHRHVPYRDSKLTRLLKDSLGGNCQTVMIANISPSTLSYDDTYNTLKYAARANSIKASIHRNVSKADLNVMQYVKVVEALTKENQAEKEKNALLEKECIRLRSELENKSSLGDIDESMANEIKALAQQKRDILERRFQLERHESSTSLRRIIKEDIEHRLSDICTSTPEKVEARDKINSTIMRFKKQESVIRNDIEKAEDITDEIDKKLDELETLNPQCKYLIQSERQKLELLRAEHRVLLAERRCELLGEDQHEKAELMEKMAGTMRSCFKLLQGHGYATPSIANQYKQIVQVLQDRKNIKWSELPDSGVSSLSSIHDDQETILLGKRKMDTPNFDQTYSATSLLEIDTNKPKIKICADPLISTGSSKVSSTISQSKKAFTRSPRLGTKPFKMATRSPKTSTNCLITKSPRLQSKSPRNKENLIRKPFETTKIAKSLVSQYGAKGISKAKPAGSILDRPRFRR